MRTISWKAAAMVCLAAAVPSCSAQSSASPLDPSLIVSNAEQELRDIGAIEIAESIADGEVSDDDYYAAARTYKSCMSQAGVELQGPQLSPVDNISLQWGYPESVSNQSGLEEETEKCHAAWRPMILAYQATHKASMEIALRDAVVSCLDELGYEVSSDATNIRELVGPIESAQDNRLRDTEGCVVSQMDKLFPDAFGITFIY